MPGGEIRYDVLCAGIAVVNFPIRPVDEGIFSRDLTQVEPMLLLPGGDAVNQAIVLSRLGNKTVLAAKRGSDAFGTILLELVRELGADVDLDYVRVDEKSATGVSAMLIRPDGQRHFCSHRSAVNNFRADDIDFSLLNRTKVASIGGLMALPSFDGEGSERFFRAAKQAGVITVADTKFDLMGIGLNGIVDTLRYTDYFFPSLDEAAALTGETAPEKMADAFLKVGAGHVGIKLGAKGCYFKDAHTEFFLPVIESPVVDTTGAGDNFMSGFITGLVREWDIERCCRFASACGAVCVSEVGPNTAIRDFTQVWSIMENVPTKDDP